MGIDRGILAVLCESNFSKAEDPKAYAKLASTGFILAHPVKINGQDKRHDNNVPYHATIKFFDKEGDNQHLAHESASKLDHQHIDPKKVNISTKVLKDRNGNDVYAVGLHGPHANKIKEHHDKLSHMGHKETYEWGAHVSVPKAVHDEIKSKGHKTAHDAGIEFGHAELKRGNKTLARYKPKISKSEDLKEVSTDSEPLEKQYKSEAQRRWAHTAAGKKALGGNAGVHEWDEATKGKNLPEKVAKSEEEPKSSKLNLEKGLKDIDSKTLPEIQEETAWTWASRAAACYEKLKETGDWKWKTDAEEYRHEAVEHAALIGDTHPTVLQEIHDALEEYRVEAQKEAEEISKSEKASRLSGDFLRRYLEDNPKLKK
jgi:hypothetical protein